MIVKKYKIPLENGVTKAIEEPNLLDNATADARAKAIFLSEGYINQTVEFTTYYTDLELNDIIAIYAPTYRVPRELNKDRFIIQNIKHYFKDGYLKSKITAIRYDL